MLQGMELTNVRRLLAFSMRLAIARILATVAASLAFLLVTGCSGKRSFFEPIAPPAALDEVRISAAWCESFDSAWWPEIERAYSVHADRSDAVIRESWMPFVELCSRRAGGGRELEDRLLAQELGTNRWIDAQLATSERQFVRTLRDELPDRARIFINLLESRMAFLRAGAQWSDGSSRLAGPLEVLASLRKVVADDAMVEAATDAYGRLTAVVQRAGSDRFDEYMENRAMSRQLDAEIEARLDAMSDPILESVAEGDGALSAPAQAVVLFNLTMPTRVGGKSVLSLYEDRAELDRGAKSQGLREIDEAVRRSLRAEGRTLAMKLTDAARRSRMLDRLDELLQAGVVSRRRLEIIGEIARWFIEERDPRDPAVEARLETLVAKAVEARALHSEGLDASSSAKRRHALDQLEAPVALLRDFLKEHATSLSRMFPAVPHAVGDGACGAGEAHDLCGHGHDGELPRDEREGKGAASIDERRDPLLAMRAPDLLIVLGLPLDGTVVTRLERDLGLSVPSRTALEPTPFASAVAKVRAELARETASDIHGDSVLGPLSMGRDPAMRRWALLRDPDAVARIEAADIRANSRILEMAAGLARVPLDDARIVRAGTRLELRRLLPERAFDSESETRVGIGLLATIDPFEVLDDCTLDAGERAVAEEVVREFGERLIDAARRAREAARSRLAASDMNGMPGERSPMTISGTVDREKEAAAGAECAALRIAIADELGSRVGCRVRRSVLESLARRAAPALLPDRTIAVEAVARFVSERPTVDADARLESLRLSLGSLLADAERDRMEILRAALLWRGSFVPSEPLDAGGPAWRLAYRCPEAWRWRSRLEDIDARIALRCESILSTVPECDALAELRSALRSFPIPRLVPMSPLVE